MAKMLGTPHSRRVIFNDFGFAPHAKKKDTLWGVFLFGFRRPMGGFTLPFHLLGANESP